MSILNINSGKISTSVGARRHKISRTIRIFDNKPGSKITPRGSQNNKVNKIKAKLSKQKVMRATTNTQHNSEVSLEILESLGCVCIKDKNINRSNFSLISTQTDTETVDNPNILDAAIYGQIAKGKVSFTNVLKNELNSFYKLDEGMSSVRINEVNKINNSIEDYAVYEFDNIVSKFYDMNLSGPSAQTPTIRGLL